MNVSIDRDTILKRLRMLAREGVDVDPAVLTPDALLADIGIDSFSLIELVFLAEEEFKIKIPFEGLEVKTVGDVVDVIEQNVAAVPIFEAWLRPLAGCAADRERIRHCSANVAATARMRNIVEIAFGIRLVQMRCGRRLLTLQRQSTDHEFKRPSSTNQMPVHRLRRTDR